jgi:hypothetical protein
MGGLLEGVFFMPRHSNKPKQTPEIVSVAAEVSAEETANAEGEVEGISPVEEQTVEPTASTEPIAEQTVEPIASTEPTSEETANVEGVVEGDGTIEPLDQLETVLYDLDQPIPYHLLRKIRFVNELGQLYQLDDYKGGDVFILRPVS